MQIALSVSAFLKRYPVSTLQDIYKGFFQDEFGPGHLLNDPDRSHNYMMKELGEMKTQRRYSAEPCGLGNNFVRVSLDLVKDGYISADEYFQLFMKSAQSFQLPEIDLWIKKWNAIEEEINPLKDRIDDYDKHCAIINLQLLKGDAVAHHSKKFVEKYDPHYRIFHVSVADNYLRI